MLIRSHLRTDLRTGWADLPTVARRLGFCSGTISHNLGRPLRRAGVSGANALAVVHWAIIGAAVVGVALVVNHFDEWPGYRGPWLTPVPTPSSPVSAGASRTSNRATTWEPRVPAGLRVPCAGCGGFCYHCHGVLETDPEPYR